MTIRITLAHNDYRLQGTIDFLNLGANKAKLELYGATKPASVNDAPGTPLLGYIELTDPVGVITANVVNLVQHEDGLVLATGIVTWARLLNGAGTVAQDMDATDTSGSGDVQLETTQLYAGGVARLITGILG